MTFEYKYYVIDLLNEPMFGFVLGSIGFIIFIFKPNLFLPKTMSKISSRISRLLFAAICILAVYDSTHSLKYGIHLIYEKESMSEVHTGRINDIEDLDHVSCFVEGKGNVGCIAVDIDDEEYVFASILDLEVGDIVSVEYLPKSRVVLKWIREET